jgi:hypothetical protein
MFATHTVECVINKDPVKYRAAPEGGQELVAWWQNRHYYGTRENKKPNGQAK